MKQGYWITILYKYRHKLQIIAAAHDRAIGRYVAKQAQDAQERETKERAA